MISSRTAAVLFHQMISTDSNASGGGLLFLLLLIIGFVIIWQSGKKPTTADRCDPCQDFLPAAGSMVMKWVKHLLPLKRI